jgi:hypothetical protein
MLKVQAPDVPHRDIDSHHIIKRIGSLQTKHGRGVCCIDVSSVRMNSLTLKNKRAKILRNRRANLPNAIVPKLEGRNRNDGRSIQGGIDIQATVIENRQIPTFN